MINLIFNDPIKWFSPISEFLTDEEKGKYTVCFYRLFGKNYNFLDFPEDWKTQAPEVIKRTFLNLLRINEKLNIVKNQELLELSLNRLLFQIQNKYSMYEIKAETLLMFYQGLNYVIAGYEGEKFLRSLNLLEMLPNANNLLEFAGTNVNVGINASESLESGNYEGQEIAQPMSSNTSFENKYANRGDKNKNEVKRDGTNDALGINKNISSNYFQFIAELKEYIFDPITEIVEALEDNFICIE